MPYLLLPSLTGQKRIPVVVIGKTHTKCHVKLLAACRLGGRWYDVGDKAWVDKTAVRE